MSDVNIHFKNLIKQQGIEILAEIVTTEKILKSEIKCS